MFDADHVWKIIVSLSMSVLGTMTRLLQEKDKHQISFLLILAEMFSGTFWGLMVSLMGFWADWDIWVIGIAAGAVACGGSAVTGMFLKKIFEKLGMKTVPTEREEEKENED